MGQFADGSHRRNVGNAWIDQAAKSAHHRASTAIKEESQRSKFGLTGGGGTV
jgi:hypothetical protein